MFIIFCFQTSWNNPSVPLMPVALLFCLISNNFLSQLEAVNLCLPKMFIFFDPSGETQLMYHLLIPDCFSSSLSLSFLSHSLSLTPSPPLSKTISSNIDRAFRKYIKYLSIISIQLHIRREKVLLMACLKKIFRIFHSPLNSSASVLNSRKFNLFFLFNYYYYFYYFRAILVRLKASARHYL